MVYIKNRLSLFELVETGSFKEKIDVILKTVLPAEMLIKKKKPNP